MRYILNPWSIELMHWFLHFKAIILQRAQFLFFLVSLYSFSLFFFTISSSAVFNCTFIHLHSLCIEAFKSFIIKTNMFELNRIGNELIWDFGLYFPSIFENKIALAFFYTIFPQIYWQHCELVWCNFHVLGTLFAHSLTVSQWKKSIDL